MAKLKEKARKKETKAFKSIVIEKDDDERMVSQYFAIYGNVDNVGDKMLNGAFAKSINERKDAIKVLWQHDATQPPIGVPVHIEEHSRNQLPEEVLSRYPDATGGLFAQVKYLNTPRGNEVYEGIREGAITENSVGYASIKQKRERGYRALAECKLYDISPVNWGANPATLNVKMAVPHMDTGIDKESEYTVPSLEDFTTIAWEELEEAEKGRIISHYAWVNTDDDPSFEDLMLAHHAPSVEGTGPAVWDGVRKAMEALLMSEVDIPSEEYRQEIWEHLARHYEEFGEAPPEYKLVNLSYYVKAVLADSELKQYAELLEGIDRKLRAEPSITTLTPVDDLYLKYRLMEHNI